MRVYINLLPKEFQKEVRLEKLNLLVLNLVVWIILSLLVIIILLFASRLFLKAELASVKDRIEMQRQVVSQEENRQLKHKLQSFNNDLSNLVNLQENQAFWSDVVIEFARLIPSDVAIDSFVADRQTGRIRITGLARTRASVLTLRNNLLASQYFHSVNFPLANLTHPTDVNFHYAFQVNLDRLMKK